MRLRAVLLATLVSSMSGSSFAAYKIALWIPSWSSDATTSIQQNAGSVQESNPVWYSWNSDGSIAKNWNAENPTIRAAMTGTQILPTVQNVVSGSFDGTTAATILGSTTSRTAHINAILQLVLQNTYDGIDIDYERVPATSRADFTTFVTSLAQQLHASGKKLSVTVYAKTSDADNWAGPGAEDWVAIGGVADSVKIMAYDYSWSTSAPGPITPLSWLDQVATYAESSIPAAKILIGLPFYGYDWGTTGTGISFATATQTATTNAATITHDVNGEATFTYGTHTVYFQDSYSYEKKMDLIKQKHSHIGGFAHWAAGQEDPATWAVITGQLPAAFPAQPAPADFSINGSGYATTVQGAPVSINFSITPINGFDVPLAVSAQSMSAGFSGSVQLSSGTARVSSPLTLTVTPDRSTAAGVYQISVRFVANGITHEKIVNVSVSEAGAGRSRSARH